MTLMNYYVKRTGEVEYFETNLTEIVAGLETGNIDPDWSVRKETDQDHDWIFIHELVPGSEKYRKQTSNIPPPQNRSRTAGITGRIFGIILIILGLACFF